MLRTVALAVLAVAAPFAAAAVSIATSLDALTDDMVARIVAIETQDEYTEEELKERAALVKARDVFYAYDGSPEGKALSPVAKALSTTYRATRDAAVAVSAEAARDAFAALAAESLAAAQAARDGVPDPARRAKISAAIDKAVATLDRGGAEPDWGKGAKYLLKGRAALDKAAVMAVRVSGSRP